MFKAGLHPDEMEDLAKSGEEGRAIKCSTRDLPLIASSHYRQIYEHNLLGSNDNISGRETQWGGECDKDATYIYHTKQRPYDLTFMLAPYLATTVAATMRLAHAAGISTFVTGEHSWISVSLSSSLLELINTTMHRRNWRSSPRRRAFDGCIYRPN